MPFAHPAVLFLLLAPAGLLVWVWRRRGRRVVLPFDRAPGDPAASVRRRSGRWIGFVVGLAESLAPLLLAGAILVLAGPQRLSEPRTKRVLTNIEFCVDVSSSMTATFGDGTRYDGSMKAIDEFLDFRKGDAFGLTFFGNNVLHWVPLTTDASAIRCSPPFMRPEGLPPWFGGTEIGKALLACKAILAEREEGDRMIVLVTDGVSSDLDQGADAEIAKTLKAQRIVVYAIHISDSQIPDQIVNLTSLTGGEVFNPGDPEALKTVFGRIDRMQKTKLEKTHAETLDHFGPFCIGALAVLAAGVVSLFGLRYTPW